MMPGPADGGTGAATTVDLLGKRLRHPPVDLQRHTADPVGGLGAEERDDAAEVDRVAHRATSTELAHAIRVVRTGPGEVDGDVLLGQVGGRGLGPGPERGAGDVRQGEARDRLPDAVRRDAADAAP